MTNNEKQSALKEIEFHREGWLESTLEDPHEAETLAELRISVSDVVLTRNYNKRSGSQSEAIVVPLFPLAAAIAVDWWRLLYEPFRAGAGDEFRARHRFDVPMHGYSFPVVALCSAGEEALYVAWGQEQNVHAQIEFLSPTLSAPELLRRDQVEATLMDLVESTLERLSARNSDHGILLESWDRIRTSIGDADELAYCKLAGRLGLDPYDPSSPDLRGYTDKIPPTLLEDISDAAFVEELTRTIDWVRRAESRLDRAAHIDMEDFGKSPADQLNTPAWMIGAQAADSIRTALGFDGMTPRREVEDILGELVRSDSAISRQGPASINVLVGRDGNQAKIGTVARTAREQRFKACRGIYLAWTSVPGEKRAGTAAFTRHQQASRAFAAEMLVPQAYLRERSPQHGFTAEQIEEIASNLVCPHDTVLWQAVHAGISLRGQAIPFQQSPSIL